MTDLNLKDVADQMRAAHGPEHQRHLMWEAIADLVENSRCQFNCEVVLPRAPGLTCTHDMTYQGILRLAQAYVDAEPDPVPEPEPRRPFLMTYRGIRVDLDDRLWEYYLLARSSQAARSALYDLAGSGGWDDVCLYCPRHRYEHGGADHAFISEEQ